MTCGFAAVLSATSTPSPVVSRLEKPARDVLASQIEAARVKLLNVKIESEGWIERRASLSEAWERTPIHVTANDPNWADTVFTVPIPQGYSVDDHVTGTEYRMGQAQKGTEKEKE
jgi:hypothetical protein